MMRRSPAPVTLAALAVLLLAASPARAEPFRLRVLTFNAWGVRWVSPDREARIARMGQEIARLRPHLVALQEVWVESDVRRLMADLAQAGLEHAREFPCRMGSGLLIASAFPIRNEGFRPFSLAGKPHKPWHGDWFAGKGIGWVRVETPAGPLVLADTHLQAPYGSSEYLPVQIAQALDIRDLLNRPEIGKIPDADPNARLSLILAGDLNCRRGSVPFRLLEEHAALQPVAEDLGIDWILFRPGTAASMRPTEVRRVLDQPVDLGGGRCSRLSDHAGVLADFELSLSEPGTSGDSPAMSPRSSVQAEAVSELHRALRESKDEQFRFFRRAAIAALGAIAFAALERRRRGKRGNFLVTLLGIACLVAFLWHLYLGGIYEPGLQRGLRAAEKMLERF